MKHTYNIIVANKIYKKQFIYFCIKKLIQLQMINSIQNYYYYPIRTLKKQNSQNSLYNKTQNSSTQSLHTILIKKDKLNKQIKPNPHNKQQLNNIKQTKVVNNKQIKEDQKQQKQILNEWYLDKIKNYQQPQLLTTKKIELEKEDNNKNLLLANNNPKNIFYVENFHKHQSQLSKQYEQSLQKFDKLIRIIKSYPIPIQVNMDFNLLQSTIRKYLQSLISFQNISKTPINPNLQQSLMKKYLLSYAYISKNLDHNKIITQENVSVKKFKNCIYFGNLKNLKKEGYGILIYFDGRVFQGLFKDDLKIQGLEIKDNQIYIGKYFEGLREDDQALIISSDIYYGKFKKGNWQRNGIKLTNDQLFFEYSKTIGICFLKTRNNDVYLGGLDNQKKNGFGIEKFGNGDFYIGNYRQSRSEGYGEYYWKNGANYKGNYFFGMRHGKGKFILKQGDSYQGQYMNDKKCGEGIYIWSNNTVYKGQFQNDFRHGYGEMSYPNGIKTKGYWILGIQKTQNHEFKRRIHKLSYQKQYPSTFRQSRYRKSVYSKQFQTRSKNNKTVHNQSYYDYRYQQSTINNKNKNNRRWDENSQTIKKKNLLPKFNLM